MCGIVGYIGKNDALLNLKSKIKLLEYRGYDSSGLCVIDSKTKDFYIRKTVGTIDKIENLKKIESSVGISHTRWATHGKINEKNAHPQLSQNSIISLVHNGIVENYQDIKLLLIENGYKFKSETDTEVICNLIEFFLKKYDIKESLKKTLDKIEGSSSIVGINIKQPEKIFIMKKGNSGGLVISENNEKEKEGDSWVSAGLRESPRSLRGVSADSTAIPYCLLPPCLAQENI